MILIYSKTLTERLKFAVGSIFNGILGVEFELTTDFEAFYEFEGCKINYSLEPVEGSHQIKPYGLLFKTEHEYMAPPYLDWKGLPIIYPLSEKDDFPFDIFSAVFFMLSRMEEYISERRDRHDRFIGKDSLAYREGFYTRPVVDEWAYELKRFLLIHHPELKFRERKFNIVPTIDIDNAFAYKYKGFFRSFAIVVKSLLRGYIRRFREAISVYVGAKKDPYDTYEYLISISKKYNIPFLYFFLLSKYGRYDRNLSPTNKKLISLMRHLKSEGQKISLHPSYASNRRYSLLAKEIISIDQIHGTPVTRSRQHYLQLKLPQTYRNLINAGIREDYTMGWSEITGFRAGTCTPFYFYDLEKEMITTLKLVPFVYMDRTLKDYHNLKPKGAMETIKKIASSVASVEGQFVFLWHNESVSDCGEWKGWRKVFESNFNLKPNNYETWSTE